jgi:hypothetical protein
MGIWLDLPPARHEFRFINAEGWQNSEDYEECWNEYGTKNNWILLD